MAYLDSEKSQRGGKPIELYKFIGTYENYYYNTSARNIKFDDGDGLGMQTYIAIPMQRSEITAGTEQDDGLDITIDLPADVPIIGTYAFESAPPNLDLTIYRYHDPLYVVAYWKGPVAQIQLNDGVGTIQSNSELSTLLAQDFPSVYYQGPCNNTLFDTRCKVVEANYSGTATCQTVNGKSIAIDVMPTGATGIDLTGKLIGGELRIPSGERRMIVSQAGVAIGVNFPFSIDISGMELNITAGCDLAYMGDCKTKFANQLNFGGFPFIGTDNPFTDTIAEGQILPDNTCVQGCYQGWRWKFDFVIGRSDTWAGQLVMAPVLGIEHFTHSANWTWTLYDPTDYAAGTVLNIQIQPGGDFHTDEIRTADCNLSDGPSPCVYIYATHWLSGERIQVNAADAWIGRLFPFVYPITIPTDDIVEGS